MIGTALAVLVLLFAVQGLLVVKVADRLTGTRAARRDGRVGAIPVAGATLG